MYRDFVRSLTGKAKCAWTDSFVAVKFIDPSDEAYKEVEKEAGGVEEEGSSI